MFGKSRGFTLVEVMISLAVFAIIAAVLFAILLSNQRSSRVTVNLVEAQQNARVAIDVLSRDIRIAGYGIDIQNDQPVVQYAAPFEIMFNANMDPYPDTSDPRGDPQALDWSGGDLPPNGRRSPASRDTTGAETVVYTLDSNMDGVIDIKDVFGAGSNEQARETRNPNDMMLMRRVYGYSAASGRNTVSSEEVALIRGPLPATQVVEPMLLYWLDKDNDGVADSLHGDANNDGVLDDSEIAALTPLEWPTDEILLRQISRVTITAIGEMPERDRSYKFNGGYRQVRVTSDVTLGRGVFIPEQRTIAGKVLRDCNEDHSGTKGLPGYRVELSKAIYDITASDGSYSFVVAPGVYDSLILRGARKPLWYLTPFGTPWEESVKTDIDVTQSDTSGLNWWLNSPYGTLTGFLFHDVAKDTSYDPAVDTFITHEYKGWGIGIFKPGQEWTDTLSPPGKFTRDDFFMQGSTYASTLHTIYDTSDLNPFYAVVDSMIWPMPDMCDFDTTFPIPLLKASYPPKCWLYKPFDYIGGGFATKVRWHMEDQDDPLDSLKSTLEFSIDYGMHWHTMKHQLPGPDSSFRWYVPAIQTNRLIIGLWVDDPDTENQPCYSEVGPLTIGIPFLLSAGMYYIRDKVPPAADPCVIDDIQMMVRQYLVGKEEPEEDTAMAVMSDSGLYDLEVYWQQDTVETELETGDSVYSDSARWIVEMGMPPLDSVPDGAWRFNLWGNYKSTAICKISFVAEMYRCDNDGQGDSLIFTTLPDTGDTILPPMLVKAPDVDFIKLRHVNLAVSDCPRLKLRLKVYRWDKNGEKAKVYFYYNGPSASYVMTPRLPEQ